MDLFDKAKQLLEEIESSTPANAELLEQFRIPFAVEEIKPMWNKTAVENVVQSWYAGLRPSKRSISDLIHFRFLRMHFGQNSFMGPTREGRAEASRSRGKKQR